MSAIVNYVNLLCDNLCKFAMPNALLKILKI